MKKYILLLGLPLILFLGSLQMFTEYTQEVVTTQKEVSVEKYNSGYRRGRLDALEEIVICDGVNDQEVLEKVRIMRQILQEQGELEEIDYSPTYHCGE